MNILKKTLFIISISLAAVLTGTANANAVSPYDSLVELKQPLVLVESNDNVKTKDYSAQWYNNAVEAVKRNCEGSLPATCDYYEYLRDFDFGNQDNSWAVFVNQTNTTFTIVTSTNPAADITFATEYPGQPYAYDYYSVNSPSNGLTISAAFSYNESLTDEDSDYLYYNGGGAPTQTPQFVINRSDVPSLAYKIYISTFPVTYPSGYDGIQIPDSYQPEIPNDWQPDIKLIQGNNWKIEFSDYNFYTFDKVAFTCGDEGFAPTIDWKVYDITNEDVPQLIDEFTYSASALNTFQAPKIQQDKKYQLTAQYSGCDDTSFINISSKEFTVKKDGSLNEADYMVVCIRDEFPFINFNDCITQLNETLSILSFNAINLNPGEDWSFTNSCRNLQVLGNWFQAGNTQICPQVPDYVRNVTTPFITFGIALLLLTFISRRGENKI